jgi:hypothetical protein
VIVVNPPFRGSIRRPTCSDRRLCPPIVIQESDLSSTQPVNEFPHSASAPQRQTLYVAEIACLLCARPVGTATSASWPPSGPVLFRSADSLVDCQVPAIWRMRCPVCGGNTAVDELATRTVRTEGPTDWQADPPRRGRPPKWLVQLREAGEPGTFQQSGSPPDTFTGP